MNHIWTREWIFLYLLCAISHKTTMAADIYASSAEWRYYGGNASGSRYSELAQINHDNVSGLEKAWEYRSGDEGYGNQFSPVMINGRLYAGTIGSSLVALDPVTGKQQWKFTPPVKGMGLSLAGRGIAYWSDTTSTERIRLFFSSGNFLYAVDGRTGKSVSTFGQDGRIV